MLKAQLTFSHTCVHKVGRGQNWGEKLILSRAPWPDSAQDLPRRSKPRIEVRGRAVFVFVAMKRLRNKKL